MKEKLYFVQYLRCQVPFEDNLSSFEVQLQVLVFSTIVRVPGTRLLKISSCLKFSLYYCSVQ